MDFEILRDVLIKSTLETDPAYGCEPDKRPTEEYLHKGVVNIDKLSGPTSHQVTSWVKDILHLDKAGHCGTLDPKVTGVFPVLLGDATKISQSILPSGKEYVCVLALHSHVPRKRIEKILKYFQGEIYQRPPVKSAVKRQLRKRTIYYITFMERDGKNILFKVGCEAGTYIRKLCHDLGSTLGVGAQMQELRRTRVASFDESNIVTLHDLKDAYEFYKENNEEKYLRTYVQPMEKAVQHLRKIWVKDTTIDSICHGANLNVPGIAKLEVGIDRDELVALFSLKNELIAIGMASRNSKEIYKMNRGAVVDLKRVIMEPGVYPKGWHGE